MTYKLKPVGRHKVKVINNSVINHARLRKKLKPKARAIARRLQPVYIH